MGVIEVGIVAFLLRAEDALQLPFGRFLYGDLAPVANGTRFGTAFVAMTLGFALVSALALPRLADRPRLAALAGASPCRSASPRASRSPGTPRPMRARPGSPSSPTGRTWRPASLWVGGLVQLAFVVWPLEPDLRRRAFLRFSRLATGLIVVILGAGIYLSVRCGCRSSTICGASATARSLLVKLALVSLALLWGAAHHFLVRPKLERGAPLFASLPRSLAGESAVGMAILLAAAVLVDSKPPPQPVSAAAARPAGTLDAAVRRARRSRRTGACPGTGRAGERMQAPGTSRPAPSARCRGTRARAGAGRRLRPGCPH